jgi:hypothetical protein
MASQNIHLNLFRHYSPSEDQQVLENNLTRALALCLQHDTLFLYALLGTIVGEEKLRSDLHLTDADERLTIDVQRSVSDLGTCGVLYPVALTEAKLTATAYATVAGWRNDSPITDFIIQYKDVLVLVEVKRTSEDCLGQLKGQVEAYQESQGDDPFTVMPATTLSWAQVVRLATNTRNLHQLTGHASPYTTDFVQFIQYHYPHWDEVLSFKSIPFARAGAVNEASLYKRLQYIQQQAFGEKLMRFNNRVSMPVDVKWASEVITRPELGEKGQGYIGVNIWPGNTKGQGGWLFYKSLDWTHCRALEVNGKTYQLHMEQYLKFSHFNRWVFEIPIPEPEIGQANFFYTREAFERYAGKWKRPAWAELEELLATDCQAQWPVCAPDWQENFVDTERNYADLALGFKLTLLLPYEELQHLDTSLENWQPVADILVSSITALRELIDGPVRA